MEENKYLKEDEILHFKEIFVKLIEEFDSKNDGIYSEDEREGILLKIISDIFIESANKNKPNLNETELKRIQGMLLMYLYECLSAHN